MSNSWRRQQLPDLAANLARRPGHEAVRTLLTDLLRHGFGMQWHEISHEVRMPEVHGRADALFGATVFEFKADLRRELPDVLARLPDYLRDRERQLRRRFLGIATDGATFVAYELRDGNMAEIARHELRTDRPEALLAWLEPALAERDDLTPDPLTVQRELGRDSLTFARARGLLERLWAGLRTHPEAALKRQLWDGLLREVYGNAVGDDGLFLQHTYLTIVAKTIAARVLDLAATDAAAILSGRALEDEGIHGAVESDFFDWVLLAPDGADLVRRVALQAARFRLRDVECDVLKALYESLIDPAQRHDLGEYYTPDWLAAKMVARAVAAPLTERVLDPACGSGTFLFHAVRRLLAAATAAGWPPAQALAACAAQVRGLDIHPVAVIIARVTWLLAAREAVLARAGALHVPVFLGDALQWNLRQIADTRDVVVPVPNEAPLHVPVGFAEDQALFEPGLQALTEGLRDAATPARVQRDLQRIPGVTAPDAAAMTRTFEQLQALYKAGRNGIWPYVLRNLVRPLWLSRPAQLADVVLGNPPWVAYRHLSAELKPRLRDACKRMNLWVGGHLTTSQDLSALFWARAAQFYLKPGGRIAFVLPYAALNAPAFAGLRRGDFRAVQVGISEGWALEFVRPLFPTSSCVLFGERRLPDTLPAEVFRFSGTLRRRDATEPEADADLRCETAAWPPERMLQVGSVYRARFRQGATIVPRRFFLVEREAAGRLGQNPSSPRVRGKTGVLDKAPWRDVEPPRGPVEARFLRPLLLGESVAPYRVLSPALAVVPVDGCLVLDSNSAGNSGHRHLCAWLRDIEAKWTAHSSKGPDGCTRMSLLQRVDHMRGLSKQFPLSAPRVVYSASGTLLSALTLSDDTVVVEHKAYWANARSIEEARYAVAILNSDIVLQRIIPLQPRGWRDPRDFDNLMWELPIPEFDRANDLHIALAEAAAHAESVAAAVVLREGADFRRHRRAIRDALAADGVAARIDALVARLLDGPS